MGFLQLLECGRHLIFCCPFPRGGDEVYRQFSVTPSKSFGPSDVPGFETYLVVELSACRNLSVNEQIDK